MQGYPLLTAVTGVPALEPAALPTLPSFNDTLPIETHTRQETFDEEEYDPDIYGPGVIVPVPAEDVLNKYVDITEHLCLSQGEAAKRLNIPTSTLSKRWKEAVRTRKWPYRAVCKLDKEILTVLNSIPPSNDGSIPEDIEQRLGQLLQERASHLKPVLIRL